MASVVSVRGLAEKISFLKPQAFRLFSTVPRLLSDKTYKADGQNAAEPEKAEDARTYKATEYYSHDKDTFADFEIEMARMRQTQPDPSVPYYHNYPWEKKSP